jgi:hypothetical protein
LVTVLRPLSTSELLDRTFHLYRNHFVLFVGIAAMPQLGVLALRLAYAERMIQTPFFGRWGSVFAVWLVTFIALEIVHAATAMAVSNLHLERNTSIGSAYSAARGSLLRVLWIAFAAFLLPILIAVPITLTIIGVLSLVMMDSGVGDTATMVFSVLMLLAIFVAPLRWWLRWSLVVPITVLEGGGLRVSMRRSKALTHDRQGRVFLVYVLIVALTWVGGAICQIPFYLTIGRHAFQRSGLISQTARLLQVTGSFLSASLVGALLTIALTLIYYDERVRREGFDMQLMMAALEPAPEAPLTSPA